MKKRIVSILLAVAMIVGMCPIIAVAAEAHEHANHDGWTVFTEATELVAGGKYYLAEDLTLTAGAKQLTDVTLCLNGHTVTAAANARVFSTAGETTICDCTANTTKGYIDPTTHLWVKGDTVPSGATAYDVKGGILTGGNMEYGAAIYNSGKLTLDGVNVVGNKYRNATNGQGGAVYILANSSLKMNNATIAGNFCEKEGGGLFVVGTAVLDGGSRVEYNYATGSGGGVHVHVKGTATLNDCSISYNTSLHRGGGICNYENLVVNDGAKITYNQALSNATGTAVKYGGGGIYASAGTMTINGGKISNNHSNYGGGGLQTLSPCVVTMSGGEISGNTTLKNGNGGTGLYVYSGTFTMTGGEIKDNTATTGSSWSGGAVFVRNGATFHMKGGKITGNYGANYGGVYAQGVFKMDGGEISGNSGVYAGAIGIYGIAGGSVTITDGIIKNNTNTGAGAQVINTVGGAAIPVTISGGTIGGTMNLTSALLNYTVTGGTFKTNDLSAAYDVSALLGANYEQDANGKVVDKTATPATYTVTFDANGGEGAPAAQTKTQGEALTLSSTVPTKTGFTFKGWATTAAGTVAYAAGASYTADEAVTLYAVWEEVIVTPPATGVEHTDHTGWTALPTSGALTSGNYVAESDLALTAALTVAEDAEVIVCLNGKTLTPATDNTDNAFINNGKLTICDCGTAAVKGYIDATSNLWTKGTAPSGATEVELTGGIITGFQSSAIRNKKGTFTLVSGNIAGNASAGNGGAIYTDDGATVVMNGGAMVGNTAPSGGGAMWTQGGTIKVIKTGTKAPYIAYNTAGGGGGAIYLDGDAKTDTTPAIHCTFEMDGAVVEKNTAGKTKSGSGGAIYADVECTVTVKNSTVSGNYASKAGSTTSTSNGRGGGLLSYSLVTISDSTFANNTAERQGGGLYFTGGGTLTGVTSKENASQGSSGGAYLSGTFTLTDCTIEKNTAATNGGGIQVAATTTLVNTNITGNIATQSGGGIYALGTVNMASGSVNGNFSAADKWDMGGGGICIGKSGRVNLSGGTVNNNYVGGTSATATLGANSRGAGIFVGAVTTGEVVSDANRAKLNISGTAQVTGNTAGGFAGDADDVFVVYTGDVTMSGGTVETIYLFSETASKNVATATVSGGTIGSMFVQDTKEGTGRASAVATITGGTFTKKFERKYPDRTVNAAITVTGGTFHTGSAVIDVTSFVPSTHEQNATTGVVAEKGAAPATYTVTFDANGGTGAPAAQTKTQGVALTLSSTVPTKSGFTFKGWATSASGTVAYAAGASYTTDSNVTLYAVWEEDVVTPPATDGHVHTDHTGWTAFTEAATIEGGKYYLTSDITLTQTVQLINTTICLNGHTVTAASGKRLFNTAQNVTICDCTSNTTDGYIDASTHLWKKGTAPSGATAYSVKGGILTGGSSEYGGAIYNTGKLTLDGITLAGNKNESNGTGGAIYVTAAGELIADNTIFVGNLVKNSGGAIGISGKMTMTNSTVEYNYCTTGAWGTAGGGGIVISSGTATITDSTIRYNECLATSQGRGGGIVVGKTSKTASDALAYLTINGNTVVSDNRGVQGAGVHVSYTGNLTVNGGTFTNNKYVAGGTGTVGDIFLHNQEGTVHAGTITINGGTIGHLRMRYSDAKDGKGVACVVGSCNITGGTVKSLTFDQKTSGKLAPTISITGGTFHSGSAVVDVTEYVAAGYAQNSTTGVVKAVATFTVTYDANGGTGAPAAQTKSEGVDLTLSSTVPVKDGFDFKGWATSATGSVAYAAGASYTADSDITLYAVWKEKVNIPTADHTGHTGLDTWYILPNGGALVSGNYVLTDNFTVTETLSIAAGEEVTICLNGKVLTNAVTSGYLFNNSGTLTICDCQTTEHKGYVDVSEKLWKQGEKTETADVTYNLTGGVITGGTVTTVYNNGTLTLKGINIAGNKSATHAAVYTAGGKTFTAEDVCVVGNHNTKVGGEGGGLYFHTTTTNTLTNCYVDYNTAGSRGGGILVYSKLTMVGGSISFNTVENSGSNIYGGGGVYNTSNGCYIENVVLEGNDGGKGTYGGAYMAGGAANYPSVFKNCTFKNNKISQKDDASGGKGGAIYTTNAGGVEITGCTFEGNHADREGGALYVVPSTAAVTFNNNTLKDNTTGVTGGGIYMGGTGWNTISNLTVTGNTSTSYGGGIYVASGTMTFENLTVTGNTGKDCGGLYVASGATANFKSGLISANKGSSSTYGADVEVIGTFNMSGGQITSSAATPGVAAYNGKIAITGGVLNGDITLGGTGSCTISGGTFKDKTGTSVYDVTKWLAAGYTQNQTTGVVTVDEASATVKVYNGTELVATSLDLVQTLKDYAGTGYTVKMFADYTNTTSTAYVFNSTAPFILDLNGHTITNTAGLGFAVKGGEGTTKIFSSAAKRGQILVNKHAAYIEKGNLHLENVEISAPASQAVSYMDPASTAHVIKNCAIYNETWHTVVVNAANINNATLTIEGSDIVAGSNAIPVGSLASSTPKLTIGEGTRLYSNGAAEFMSATYQLTADSKTLTKASLPSSATVCGEEHTGLTMWAIGNVINNANGLLTALDSDEGGLIILNTNISLSEDVTVKAGTVLDLNGNDLNVDDGKFIYVEGTIDASNGDLGGDVVITDRGATIVSDNANLDVTTNINDFEVAYENGEYVLKLTGHDGHAGVNKTDWQPLSATEGALTSGYYLVVDDHKLTGALTVAAGENVTICLNGNTITAGSELNAFITEGNLTICDCTSTVHYGAVDATTRLWKEYAVSQGDNAVDLKGGVITGAGRSAVNVTGGTFKLESGNIAGNKTTGSGAGVYVAAAGKFVMNGGSVTGNYATGSYGGGVYVVSGEFEFNAGSVGYNTAALNGGGIGLTGSTSDAATFAMTGGTVIGNVGGFNTASTSGSQGGGIYVNGSSTVSYVNATITGGTITKNECKKTGNSSSGRGGGILSYSALTVKNATISDNIATTGGGLYASAGAITMENVTLSGNTAKGAGGAAYLCSATTLTDCVIKDNTASTSGGGLDCYGSSSTVVTMTDCEVTGNTSKGTTTTRGSLNGGGGINIGKNAKVTVNGGKISGNTAQYAGGGVCASGNFILNDSAAGATEISENNLILQNWTLGGSGVYVEKTTGNFTMNGGKICNNYTTKASVKGLSIMSSGTTVMNGGEISGNVQSLTVYGNVAIFEGTFTMNGGTIKNNKVNQGGGFYIYGETAGASTTPGGTLIINGGEISGNEAVTTGGGISTNGINAKIEFNGGVISGNTATTTGGGIHNGGVLTITAGEIKDNTAKTYGGGIYNNSGELTIANGVISGNKAKDGGGLYAAGANNNMTGGEISGNKGANGAGVEVIGTFNMSGGKIVDNGSTNQAEGFRGGAIYIYTAGTANISGGEISGNKVTATGNGTGVFAYGPAKLYISGDADIKDNVAGGASSATAYPTIEVTGGKVGGFVEDGLNGGIGLKNLLISGGTSYGKLVMNATTSSDKFLTNRGIIGGTFRNADDSDITDVTSLLSAYATQDMTTGTVTAYAATIGTEKYLFFAEAVAAAQPGQTIVLRNPVEVNSDITLPTGVGLNINSAAVSGTATLTVDGPFIMESGSVTCTLVLVDPTKAVITGGDLGTNDVSAVLDGIYYDQFNGKVFRTAYLGDFETADAVLKVTAATTDGGEAKTFYFNSFYAFDETAESELFKGVLAKLYGYDHDNDASTPDVIKFGITKTLLGPNAITSTSTETSGAWLIEEDQTFADPDAELLFDLEGKHLQINADKALPNGINGTGGFFATRNGKGMTFANGRIELYASSGRAVAYVGTNNSAVKDASGNYYRPVVNFENMEVVSRGKNIAATSTTKGATVAIARTIGAEINVENSYLWAENHHVFYIAASTAATADDKAAEKIKLYVDGKSQLGSTAQTALGGNTDAEYFFEAGMTLTSKTKTFPATGSSLTVTPVAPASAISYVGKYTNGANTEHTGLQYKIIELTARNLSSGKEITLLGDAVLNGDATISIGNVLDLNGYTLSGTGTLTVAGTLETNGGTCSKATKGYTPVAVPKKNRVNIEYVAGGKVTSNTVSANIGTVVTLKAEPDVGYILYEMLVTNSKGKILDTNKKSANAYSVKMASGGINVKATFIEDPTGSAMVDCYGGEGCACNNFSDLYSSEWYHAAADYVIEGGLMNGMSATQFQPNGTLSRAMLAQILFNMEGGYEQEGKAKFSDVKTSDWYYNAVVWAAENGIVTGYNDGSFKPNAAVTREQAAAMLNRFAKMRNAKGKMDDEIEMTDFSDNASVSSWAAADMEWAVRTGIITGTPENTLNPNGNATRIQMAAMLMRFSKNVLL